MSFADPGGRDGSRAADDLRLLDPESAFSLSEYDLAPMSAPFFIVGELIALLHSKGALKRDRLSGALTFPPTIFCSFFA
jgi:hypothetical protein